MTFWRDLIERAVATYVEVFLGLLIVAWSDVIDVSVVQTAAIAALPALLSVLKAGAASFRGDPDSASLVA